MMDATVPWMVWAGAIELHYTDTKGTRGRKAKPIATMLRTYLLAAVWFSLLDEARGRDLRLASDAPVHGLGLRH